MIGNLILVSVTILFIFFIFISKSSNKNGEDKNNGLTERYFEWLNSPFENEEEKEKFIKSWVKGQTEGGDEYFEEKTYTFEEWFDVFCMHHNIKYRNIEEREKDKEKKYKMVYDGYTERVKTIGDHQLKEDCCGHQYIYGMFVEGKTWDEVKNL